MGLASHAGELHRLRRVISGGQTGADQGALEAAFQLGIPTGGTAPEGFLTHTGNNPRLLRDKYGMRDNDTTNFAVRTIQNVNDSCATIVWRTQRGSGTDMTIYYAVSKKWEPIDKMLPEDGQKPLPIIFEPPTSYKPILVITSLREKHETEIVNAIVGFLTRPELSIRVVNVAGHRGDVCYGIQRTVQRVLSRALKISLAIQEQGAVSSESSVTQGAPTGASEPSRMRTLEPEKASPPRTSDSGSKSAPTSSRTSTYGSGFGSNWLWWNKLRFAPRSKKTSKS